MAVSPELDESAGTGRKVSLRLVWRAVRRHWWQAFLLWLSGSSALMALAYHKVKPTYDARARVRVEPGEQSLITKEGKTRAGDFTEFQQTQVASVTSPSVLGMALAAHPELHNLPRLRRADDPEVELRLALQVTIVPRTNLVEVSMASESPTESAAIVSAVVDAYLKNASASNNEEKQKWIKQLQEIRDDRDRELESKRAELQRLNNRIKTGSSAGVRDRNLATLDQYRRWSEELAHVEITAIATQAKVEQLRDSKAIPRARKADDEQVRLAVQDAFYSDPRVASVQAQLDRIETQLGNVRRLARRSAKDPSRVNLEGQAQTLKTQIAALWGELGPKLQARVMEQIGHAAADVNADREVIEAEGDLAALRSQANALRTRLDQMSVQNKEANSEVLLREFARLDVERASQVLHVIEDNLGQLQSESHSPLTRVQLESPARRSNRPNSANQIKIMALAPIVTLAGVLSLFVLLEARSGRVADPDELPGRVHVPVLSVVPPLPMVRSVGMPSGREEFRLQRQLDEFVRSLDHLRVALCARPDPWGRDRHCIVITSACGSEGKTTLAAQLAERCVNAGLTTLLIDGDLRNPTLSRMLAASARDGLVNVLRGEATAEDAMLVIGDAGGFHFLPSGTPRSDPGRLLQGEALGRLIARARESFEMIIVDAPPVLSVSDALSIGRWTDGAVLAVRHGTSRFSLLDRANRRLVHVGVPVLGAVVNGVRSADSSYGGYYASRTSPAPKADTLDG
jgi:capsular exopolysaccharide synthesis family protein